MSTAIVGLGNIGSRLAKNLIAGGQRIIVADTTLAKAQKLAGKLGGNAEAVPVADAIGKANVAILAIYFDAIKQLIATYRGALAQKSSSTHESDRSGCKGGFNKTIPAEQSSGQLISALLPNGARLVKAFGTLSAQSLASGADRSRTRGAVLCNGLSGGRQNRSEAH